MKKLLCLAAVATGAAASAQWTPGNLIVAIIGDGSTALFNQTAYPVTLRQYSTSGVQVGPDLALPTSPAGINRTLTSQSDETSEAGLQLSEDRRYILIAGYDAPPLTGSPGFGADRTVARVPSFLFVDTSTGLPYAEAGGDSVRTVYSVDGNTYWVASGSAGIDYLPHGVLSGSNEVVGNFSSARFLGSFGGNFYYSSSDDNLGFDNSLYRVDGKPTSGPVPPLIELVQNPSPRAFVFTSPTVLYMASSTASAGLIKYENIGGTWVEQYRSAGITGGINALVRIGSQLYATRSNGTTILSITDTGAGFTSSIIATAPTDTIFRGLSVSPNVTLPIRGRVTLEAWQPTPLRRRVTVEVAPSGGPVAETTVAALDANGDYTVATALAPGSYDVYIKDTHWLRRKVSVTLMGSGATGVNALLLNGDVDGDNEVTIGDYSQLSVAFGSEPGDPNWNVEADLNGDDTVDIGDYAILSTNFGEVGD